jgi:hypothetical protein
MSFDNLIYIDENNITHMVSFFFLLDHFLDLLESKWLYEYIIKINKIYIF